MKEASRVKTIQNIFEGGNKTLDFRGSVSVTEYTSNIFLIILYREHWQENYPKKMFRNVKFEPHINGGRHENLGFL